jgi:AhpD family alkylhydroperoxidase
MNQRFNMGKVQPAAYKAMDAMDKYIGSSGIPAPQREMIRIRASQINGCAYCVHEHSEDALKGGESPQRIFLMGVWREAGDIFSDEEKLLLEMTEEITLIHRHGLSDSLYDRAMSVMGEEKTAQVIMLIISINSWNRIGVALNMHPSL